MKSKGTGVAFYSTGRITYDVHFPNGVMSCAVCSLCHKRSGFDEYECEKYHKRFDSFSAHNDILPECLEEMELIDERSENNGNPGIDNG